MATGSDDEGEKTKTAALHTKLRELLQMTPEINDRARLAAIFFLTQEGIHKDDRDSLMSMARLSPNTKDAIEAMVTTQMKLKSTKTVASATKAMSSLRSMGFKKKDASKDPNFEEDVYTTFRYKPPLKSILLEFVAGTLSNDDYPYVSAPVASNVGGSKRTKFGSDKKKRIHGPKIITFVAGGVSYSEIRSCYEVTTEKSRNVTIGGSSIIDPKTYLGMFSDVGGIEVVVQK